MVQVKGQHQLRVGGQASLSRQVRLKFWSWLKVLTPTPALWASNCVPVSGVVESAVIGVPEVLVVAFVVVFASMSDSWVSFRCEGVEHFFSCMC